MKEGLACSNDVEEILSEDVLGRDSPCLLIIVPLGNPCFIGVSHTAGHPPGILRNTGRLPVSDLHIPASNSHPADYCLDGPLQGHAFADVISLHLADNCVFVKHTRLALWRQGRGKARCQEEHGKEDSEQSLKTHWHPNPFNHEISSVSMKQAC